MRGLQIQGMVVTRESRAECIPPDLHQLLHGLQVRGIAKQVIQLRRQLIARRGTQQRACDRKRRRVIGAGGGRTGRRARAPLPQPLCAQPLAVQAGVGRRLLRLNRPECCGGAVVSCSACAACTLGATGRFGPNSSSSSSSSPSRAPAAGLCPLAPSPADADSIACRSPGVGSDPPGSLRRDPGVFSLPPMRCIASLVPCVTGAHACHAVAWTPRLLLAPASPGSRHRNHRNSVYPACSRTRAPRLAVPATGPHAHVPLQVSPAIPALLHACLEPVL